jgi:hypothetical protein
MNNNTSYIVILATLILVFSVIGVRSAHARSAKQKQREIVDLDRVLEAIRSVEHWDGRSVGASGERGPWQMTRDTWRQFSHHPFHWAGGRGKWFFEEQRAVAYRYLLWIETQFEHANHPITPYSLALAWTAGVNAVLHNEPRRPSRAKHDYAERAENLYRDMMEVSAPESAR